MMDILLMKIVMILIPNKSGQQKYPMMVWITIVINTPDDDLDGDGYVMAIDQ